MGPGISEGVGGHDVDFQPVGERFQAFSNAVEELPVQGQGAVVVQDEVGELQGSVARDGDFYHECGSR